MIYRSVSGSRWFVQFSGRRRPRYYVEVRGFDIRVPWIVYAMFRR